MSEFKAWMLEPRDPLVVRDGRPPAAGMPQSSSLDFPWPSTVAGLARTQAGSDEKGHFDSSRVDALLRESIKGPLLLELDDGGAAREVALPAPRDVVAFRDDQGGVVLKRLVPRAPSAAVNSNLPDGLRPLGFPGGQPKGKPSAGGGFWRWRDYARWLTRGEAPAAADVLLPLLHERRFHVAIDPATGTAADGKLFVSDGLRFWGAKERLALGFATTAGLALKAGAVRLGGEGRVSWLREQPWSFPSVPPELLAALESSRLARVIVTTPAIFDGGALPVRRTVFGAPIVAARVDRPAVISGWDHARGAPKHSRRMVPAGSVFWVDLKEVASVKDWLSSAWGEPVGEQQEQDRRDGFGLAFVGVAS